MPKYKSDRLQSTQFAAAMVAEIAWGDAFGSTAEIDADAERANRRARWLRRKGGR